MQRFKIENHTIGGDAPCFIIAEGGLNHNGDKEIAKRLIGQASECGADAIKFQTYTTEELFPPEHPDYKTFQHCAFDQKTYLELQQEAAKYKIIFLSTPFDEASADLLESINVPAYKIGSGELTHHALLKYIARKNKPLILSTGMSRLEEIDAALEVIRYASDAPLALLHCVSAYPCPLEEAAIRGVQILKERYDLPVGYSDHTSEDAAALGAVALGAKIIEKHFTLSHHLPGWDHFFSYDTEQFARLVKGIRAVETALSSTKKIITEREASIHSIARRSIYARCAINKGEKFTQKNLLARRPVGPIPADQLEAIIGKTADRDITAEAPLKPGDYSD